MINLMLINYETNMRINLPKDHLNKMLHICNKSNPYETGGIIIGRYSDDNLTANITEISTPTDDSVKQKFAFKRGIMGLQKKLNMLWEKNYYYLGEWHYHPNSSPIPSKADFKQMLSLSQDKKLNCPEPILIIVGGSQQNWTYSFNVIVNGKFVCFEEQ